MDSAGRSENPGDLEYSSPNPEALMDNTPLPDGIGVSEVPTAPSPDGVGPENPFVPTPHHNFQDPEPPSYIHSTQDHNAGPEEEDRYVLENPLKSNKHTLLCLGVASLILLFSSSIECNNYGNKSGCSGSHAFGVATAVVSIVITIVYLVHEYRDMLGFLPENFGFYFSAFSFFWWVVALFVLTMSSPFAEPSNGYFAVWAGFICSNSLLHREAKAYRFVLGYLLNIYERSRPLATVLFASVIEMIAAVPPCASSECTGDEAFAIVVGVISILICIILFVMYEKIGSFAGYLIGFLCIWWLLGVVVFTFQGPFTGLSGAITNANGFFATWVALFSSAWLLASGKRGDSN